MNAPLARDNPVYHVLCSSLRFLLIFDMAEPTFTAREIATIQTELRAALGLAPEAFPISTFISMVSDEIEQLRKKGFADEDIAKMVRSNSQVDVSAEDIDRHYAPPEARGRPKANRP